MNSYGVHDKTKAEALAAYLAAQHPENKYEVAIHDHRSPNWMLREPVRREPATWGVVRYVPYCEQMPFRCDGFVWWDYELHTPSVGLLTQGAACKP